MNHDLQQLQSEVENIRAMTAWKYGWIVEVGKVLCPNCRADEEDWKGKEKEA